jgi:hypothetical protein
MLIRPMGLDIPPTTNRGVKSVEGSAGRLPTSQWILKSAGIDYLTLTSTNRKTKKEMGYYFARLVAADHLLGYDVVSAGGHGFYGKRVKHGSFTHKEDRSMLSVSGERAQKTILLCYEGDSCPRLDIQITVYLGGESADSFLRRMERAAMEAPRIRGHKPLVDHYASDGLYQTVYIGSKKSDLFMRLYDKGAESGRPEYAGCVRFEVQLRNKASNALWSHCAKEAKGTMYLLSVLLGLLDRRGIDMASLDLQRQDIVRPKAENTKENVLLGWWASQVAPSVARYSALGGWQTAFRTLFSNALTEHDLSMIMNALSLQWGN